MARTAYPSDLTDDEWSIIEPLLPGRKAGRQGKTTKREILNAILFVLRTGTQWRYLPHDFPHWRNVYDFFLRWTRKGILVRINDALRDKVRSHEGKNIQPSAAIIDSQSVKTTETGSGKGFDAGKKNQGHQAPSRRRYTRPSAGGPGDLCGRSGPRRSKAAHRDGL
jgi:transposase